MKKTILSFALVLAGLMGSTAMAQSPVALGTNNQVQSSKCTACPADKKASPFDGLNLSEKQQAELKALRDGCKAERAKIAAKEKADRKEMVEQRKKDQKEYLGKIKEILTPEQYVQFLENCYLNNGIGRPFGHHGDKKGMRPGKHGKMSKDGRGMKQGKSAKSGRTQATQPQAQTTQQ